MIKYSTCIKCGDTLDKAGVCSCEKFFVEDKKCPECGSLIFCYNDPSEDSTLGEYCTNMHCEYTANQYMSWEEIKSSMCAVNAGEDCVNCLHCLGM